MGSRIPKAILVIVFIFIAISYAASSERELMSRYATILYNSDDQLRRLDKEISLGSLSYLLRNKKNVTVNDEVRNKLDVLVERVETILAMYPKEVKFTVVLLSSDKEVREIFRKRYGKDADYISFYSPKNKTMYISVRDIDIGILAHEISHMIIDSYYGIGTPEKIHEVLAQYVETHLKD